MPVYLDAKTLRHAVSNIEKSTAKSALYDFLIVKRTLAIAESDSAPIVETDTSFRQALDEMARCHWDDAELQDRAPFINVFSLNEKKRGYRTKKHPSNGTNTNVAGTKWGAILDLSSEKPRKASFRDGYEKYLTALTNKKGKPEKRPNLHLVACWVYRSEDLKPRLGDEALTFEALANLFISDYQLSNEEVKAVFDATAPVVPGLPAASDTLARPQEYLPTPPSDVQDADEQDDEEDKALVMAPAIDDNDPLWKVVKRLLDRDRLNFMLSGPPGTSKTWYAYQLALKITDGNLGRVHQVQFHPSYGYEDFVQGMVPVRDEKSEQLSFELVDRTFVEACRDAATEPHGKPHVLIIEEFSRGDASRILGELLTLIEPDYRGRGFTMLSGDKLVIPRNLIIIGTMNPYDKSVSDIDDAMERRFAWLELSPNTELLKSILEKNGMDGPLMGRVINFFNVTNRKGEVPNGLGHALFVGVTSESDLELLWNHSLRKYLERRLRYQDDVLAELKAEFKKLFTTDVELI